MAAVLGLSKSAVKSPPLAHAKLQFLIQLEPAHRVFFSNVVDFFRRPKSRIVSTSMPGAFWPDVFVVSQFPWLGFLESLLWHGAALAALWALSHVWLLRPPLVTHPTFTRSDVLYYAPAEYLPPIDTGRTPARSAQKGEPEFAKQPIISVPREADNRSQTIITPPNVKLTHDVQVPNIVAWNQATPSMPLSATSPRLAAPAPEVLPVAPPPEIANTNTRRILGPETTIIAPAPEVGALGSQHLISGPQVAVVAPPPTVQGEIRKLGDINIGQSVVQPAPELPVSAQRVPVTAIGLSFNSVVPPPPSLPPGQSSGTARVAGTGNTSGQVVPPPPSLGSAGRAAANGRLIALGIHPTATPPPPDLAGNRRGRFAASPRGKVGASGTPEISASSSNARADGVGGNGNGRGAGGSDSSAASGVPEGIYVGAGPNNSVTSATNGYAKGNASGAGVASSAVMADTRPMRVTVIPHTSLTSNTPPSEIERSVFHDRKSYSMILNMPNLNSAGGSWVIRFAEKAQNDAGSDLTAPQATRKVDPGYPAELMRQNVQGTVILYAVIHRDGSVGDVRILSSVDERLDQFARAALSRWQFRPATRNGNAVDLDAVVTIPFRSRSNF